MANNLSKTQIDKLGERLRRGEITEADLRMLDEYRRSFSEAYELVVRVIRTELALEPTGRPAKSTTSISDKLIRDSIRLSQIQDIAGCRVVVSSVLDQDRVCESIANRFEHKALIDRRKKPSHGYRAVHIIIRIKDKFVEIQIRTSLQHMWAELSEKLSDVMDPAIKYGGGDQSFVSLLATASKLIGDEEAEQRITAFSKLLISRLLETQSDVDRQEELFALQEKILETEKKEIALRENIFRILEHSIDTLPIKKK